MDLSLVDTRHHLEREKGIEQKNTHTHTEFETRENIETAMS